MFKLILSDFMGRPKAYYVVNEERIPANAAKPVRQVGHLLFVTDVSGSMWGDLDGVKSMAEKLLTLEEYRDADVLASVLSFSSAGDLVTHIARVPVSEIMKPGSKHIEEIRKLQTRGLTCISQGLKAISSLVQPGEVTAAVVLSDGFANDRSPGAEKREIDVIVDQLSKLPNLFVNTIAFRAWADYKLLAFIANACSGTCFQAPSAKEVYDVLHDTTSLLAGSTAPAIDLALGAHDYQVFVSQAARKIVGGGQNLLIRGLRPEDDKVVYRFKKVEAAVYNASTAPECGTLPILAFAKAQLAEGNINTAKYALVATRDQDLLARHARALVNSEIAAMSADVEDAVYNGIPADHTISSGYGLPNANIPSVLAVLGILADHARDIEVDLAALRSGYKRRGVKRISGVRLPDGTIEKPWVKTAFRDNGDWAQVSSFDINRNNATCNMLVTRAINLVKADDGSVIPEIAGVKLDLKSYNNYTIIGDGLLNVGKLRVRIGNKRLFRALVQGGVLLDVNFDPKTAYEVALEGRPLIGYDATFSPSMFDGVFARVARLKVLASILTASTKGTSEKFTDDQIAELKKHYLTTSMYVSFPTTNEYADLQQALADGVIDTRLSYKVDFGTPEILNLGELYSANEYLARRFTFSRNGAEEKKPKFEMRWDDGAKYGVKPLTARTKLNACDDVMYPIFLDFLGLQSTGQVAAILADAGLDADFATNFLNAAYGKTSKDTAVELFSDARKAVEGAIERTFREQVSPLVFYVGATGLIPDDFNSRAMTAEQVKEKYPDVSIGKDATEGTFYEINGTLLVVFTKAEYFSTGKAPAVDDEEDAA